MYWVDQAIVQTVAQSRLFNLLGLVGQELIAFWLIMITSLAAVMLNLFMPLIITVLMMLMFLIFFADVSLSSESAKFSIFNNAFRRSLMLVVLAFAPFTMVGWSPATTAWIVMAASWTAYLYLRASMAAASFR